MFVCYDSLLQKELSFWLRKKKKPHDLGPNAYYTNTLQLVYWFTGNMKKMALAPLVINSCYDLSGQQHATRGKSSAVLAQAKGI